MTSFITCEPASNVPIKPNAAIFQASGSRFTKNSETILWLPGGKNRNRSVIKPSRFVFPPIRLVASAPPTSNAGKNARNRLYAIACEIMLQRGNTRPNVRYARRMRSAAEIIARHYTRWNQQAVSGSSFISEILRPLLHVDHREHFAVHEWNGDRFHRNVASYSEELCPRQRRTHLVSRESLRSRGRFAGFQNHSADALPRPGRMDEKRANLCGIVKRIEKLVFSARPAIAAIERLTFAPAAATDDETRGSVIRWFIALTSARCCLRDEIGSVGNQLAIHPKNGLERTLDLRRRVILRLQAAYGRIDERLQNRNIAGDGKPQMNVRLQDGLTAQCGHVALRLSPPEPKGHFSKSFGEKLLAPLHRRYR